MLNFTEYLKEAFDKPYRFIRKELYKGNIVYRFVTEEKDEVDVILKENEISDDESSWTVTFERNMSQQVTGGGDAMRIFATVIEVIKDFVKKEKPQELVFSAEKPAWRANLHHKDPKRSKDMGSREKLYKRLVQRYAGRLGYKYTTQSDYGATDFRLVKK
tara:strand:- start:1218 stop:1697 length:480 start_codon:yes stop_codon:yes gene_type:complete